MIAKSKNRVKYDELDPDLDLNIVSEALSTAPKRSSNDVRCERQRNSIKLLFHCSIVAASVICIASKTAPRYFLFAQLVLVMCLFNAYYLFVMVSSPQLHWFQHRLVSIEGVSAVSLPIPWSAKENSRIGIFSISELSAYPGSTSHYVLSTGSSYVFTLTLALTVLLLDERYDFDLDAHFREIASLLVVCGAAFGFLLAGHWSVFENVLSTVLHTLGFAMTALGSTVAIYLQQGAHWLCIVGSTVSVLLLALYGYLRAKYVRTELENRRKAHSYSVREILLEWLTVIIFELQCVVFLWTAMKEE